MKYMLDTSICIYLIKQHPANMLKKFTTLKVGDVCMSSITLAELVYGIEKSHYPEKNKAALDEFILPLNIMSFDEDAAAYYGKIRRYLEEKGTPIGSLDTMIAAHALCLDIILVTNNTHEFCRVPHLMIENWV